MNSLRSLYLRADATELAQRLRQGEIHGRERYPVRTSPGTWPSPI